MDLYLVRHAIAEPRGSASWPDDSKRPLTPTGSERFRAAARGLRRLEVEIDAMLASPYVRAWHTAEILSKEAAWPTPEELPALEPSTSPRECLDVLRDRRESTLALVGHQPQLSKLASLLLAGDERSLRLELKKGAAMCLRFEGKPEAGNAALRWSMSPRILGSLGR